MHLIISEQRPGSMIIELIKYALLQYYCTCLYLVKNVLYSLSKHIITYIEMHRTHCYFYESKIIDLIRLPTYVETPSH